MYEIYDKKERNKHVAALPWAARESNLFNKKITHDTAEEKRVAGHKNESVIKRLKVY